MSTGSVVSFFGSCSKQSDWQITSADCKLLSLKYDGVGMLLRDKIEIIQMREGYPWGKTQRFVLDQCPKTIQNNCLKSPSFRGVINISSRTEGRFMSEQNITSEITSLRNENAVLKEELALANQQLEWFRK